MEVLILITLKLVPFGISRRMIMESRAGTLPIYTTAMRSKVAIEAFLFSGGMITALELLDYALRTTRFWSNFL